MYIRSIVSVLLLLMPATYPTYQLGNYTYTSHGSCAFPLSAFTLNPCSFSYRRPRGSSSTTLAVKQVESPLLKELLYPGLQALGEQYLDMGTAMSVAVDSQVLVDASSESRAVLDGTP